MPISKVKVEVERIKLNPMGELPPVKPEWPKKIYNRFAGNPPEDTTPAQAYLGEMGVELDPEGRPLVMPLEEPILIHETVHGHEPHSHEHEDPKKTKK